MSVVVYYTDIREDETAGERWTLLWVVEHMKDEGKRGVKVDYQNLSCRQPTEGGNIANGMNNEGLMPNINKQLTQRNIKDK